MACEQDIHGSRRASGPVAPPAPGAHRQPPWGTLAAIDVVGCRPERLAVDHVCALVPALLAALGARARGELVLHAVGAPTARQLLVAQAVEGGGSLTLHVDLGGRRCLVDLLLRASFAGDTAAEVAGRWLDGAASLTVLRRGVRAGGPAEPRAPPARACAHPPPGGATAPETQPMEGPRPCTASSPSPWPPPPSRRSG